jgi:FkbM family methyltransferase
MSIINETQAESLELFKKHNAEEKRYDYPELLNPNSLFIDLGVHNGDWSARILKEYPNTRGIGFEASDKIYNKVKNRLTDRFKLYNEAVSDYYGTADFNYIGPSGEGSSLHLSGKGKEVNVIKFSDFIITEDISKVTLLKINIEGSEFEILEDLYKSNLLSIFKNIQVQFHTFAHDAENRYSAIRDALRENHVVSYYYPWIWENWELKDGR